MANPVSNHLVSGIVRDRFGGLLIGVTITLTHTSISPVLSTTTGSDGKYILNLGDLDEQWNVGQNITLACTVQFKGRKISEVAITSQEPQTVDLTLEETSALTFAETDETQRHNLVFALPTTYDGEKVTHINPLPVQTSEVDLLYNPSRSWTVTNQDGQPDSETVTLTNGDEYKRTFGYSTVSGARILTSRSKWVKQ